jgi:hypothetical protein
MPGGGTLGEGFGALLPESCVDALRAGGARHQRVEATLVEGVDGVTHLLTGAAPQTRSYLGRGLSTSAREECLGSAQDEGVFGAQPGLQGLALLS